MTSKILSSSSHFGGSTNDCFKVGEFERRLDALLADLQNSVPGRTYKSQYSTANQYHNHADTTGYGSLRGRALPKAPVYQEPYSSTETRRSQSPQGEPNYSTIGPPTNAKTSHSYYQNQGAMPRNAYNNGSTHNNSRNLSELDSLLEDLSNSRHNNFESKGKEKVVPINYNSHSSKYNTNNTYATIEPRPTMDSLLDEMDSGSIYAVPHGAVPSTPGRHVSIKVHETTTEKVTGPQGPVGSAEEKVVYNRDMYTPHGHPPNYGSSATRELDELMASLSDFKVGNGSNHHHQTVTDYAKPNKGVSHLTQTITETTTSQIVEDHPQTELHSMLGNLQSNMSLTSAANIQKGWCNACEKAIVGQVISALGKTWHPEHFTCNHCNQELGTRNFFERDGFPYCEPDYHNLFSPRCAYCNGAILDKCVTALDKTWHTEHFFCAQCGQQFGEDGFHERDGKPYCRNDYFEMFAPKCNGCNRAIMENYISALNSQWHPDCFVCRDCKKAVRGKSFYAMEDKPVCPTCAGVAEEE